MNEQFTRTAKVFGEGAINILATKRVIVFGIGGVGGHAIEALARGGIGFLTIVDKDMVDITNMNRQLIATTETIGVSKAKAMKERISQIAPECKTDARECFFLPDNSNEFDFEKYDYIVDAIDNVTGKMELIERADSAGIPIISCMGTGNKLDPTRFEVTDISKTSVCPLAKVIRTECRKRNIEKLKVVYSKELPISCKTRTPGSVSFVPGVAGMIMAGEVIKDLLRFQSDKKELREQ